MRTAHQSCPHFHIKILPQDIVSYMLRIKSVLYDNMTSACLDVKIINHATYLLCSRQLIVMKIVTN